MPTTALKCAIWGVFSLFVGGAIFAGFVQPGVAGRSVPQKCGKHMVSYCGFCLLHLLSIEDIMSIYIELHRHDGYHIAPPPKMYRFQFFVDVKEVVFVGNLLQKQSRYTITFKKDEHILRSESTTFLEGSNLF